MHAHENDRKGLRFPGMATTLMLMLIVADTAFADRLTLRPGMTGVPDLGAIGCELFNEIHPNGPTGLEQQILTWAGGYFYARTGKTIDEVLELPSNANEPWNFDSLAGHIVAYCAAHPDARVPEAVIDLWGELEPEPAAR